MQEPVSIDIEYDGEILNLGGYIQSWDYQHHIELEVGSMPVIFELNERFEYRISESRQDVYLNKWSPVFLNQIAHQLTSLYGTGLE